MNAWLTKTPPREPRRGDASIALAPTRPSASAPNVRQRGTRPARRQKSVMRNSAAKGFPLRGKFLGPVDTRPGTWMPGPNSAPNGDVGLIKNHPLERIEWCSICKKVLPARVDDAKHNRLRTGKTIARG